ncbi:uncharacterized protein [Rutidosis leptorrhynchoides]|uniref:uncharacterized protein isoform X1 n=1 Tax=Rutidosis leptorrhynchoides TaxID=125765 RepID=UPI003A98FD4C
METKETKLISKTKGGKVAQMFSQFMERVAKFEEINDAGNRYLVSFRQGLEFIRRPPIENTSELFKKVVKTNNTHRMQSYIEAGYVHTSNRCENLNKLNTSHIQLLGNVSKAKNIIVELENLVEDVKLALEAAIETEYISNLDPISPTSNEDDIVSIVPEKPKDVDYATMVAVVYSMVKQDYVMQEKIVTSLNLNTSSGELESYCLMWSLRPFINDEIMHQAWKLIS